jgi:hypothetical protein
MPNAEVMHNTMYNEVQAGSTNLTIQLMQGRDLTGVQTVVKKLAAYTGEFQ